MIKMTIRISAAVVLAMVLLSCGRGGTGGGGGGESGGSMAAMLPGRGGRWGANSAAVSAIGGCMAATALVTWLIRVAVLFLS